MYNLLPKDMRDMQGVTVDTFKTSLDSWLSQVPDQPTVVGRQALRIKMEGPENLSDD